MRLVYRAAATAALLLTTSAAEADVSIPFTKTTLANGMTLIIHEDHAVPIAVVNVSYSVGSHYETQGRTGFAHLFEHLMFMGTRRAPTKAFDAWMESAGGWNNAWTSQDRTDYYDVGPPTALDLLMWLESDRLRDLGPLMTLEKLNAQREVVLFEEDEALLRAQLIERDAERDGAEPRIEADVLPDELPDVRDDLRVRLGECVLGRRLGAETREEDAAIEARTVLVEQLAERVAVALLGLRDELLVDGVGLGARLRLGVIFVDAGRRTSIHAAQPRPAGGSEARERPPRPM